VGRLEQLRAFLDEVHPDLDLYSYYQLLELEENASLADVRAAFYRQAARLHPDRFAGLGDPALLAKLVASGADRAEALGRLRIALAHCRIEGVATNVAMHAELAANADFARGGVDTSWFPSYVGSRHG